jgi:hypothetical protein
MGPAPSDTVSRPLRIAENNERRHPFFGRFLELSKATAMDGKPVAHL